MNPIGFNGEPSREPLPVQTDTIDLLLGLVDLKLRTVEAAPDGTHYNEFDGQYLGVPTRFLVRQIPVELSGEYKGAIAIIGLKPTLSSGGIGGDTTEYRFRPTLDGSVELKKMLPFSWQTAYHEAANRDPDASYIELHKDMARSEASARAEEEAQGFDIVYEDQAQDLLTALKESREDPVRNALVKKLRNAYENKKRRNK